MYSQSWKEPVNMKHKGSEQEEGKREPDGAPCDKKRFKRTLTSATSENTIKDEEKHEGPDKTLLQPAEMPIVSRQVALSGTDSGLLTMLHMLEERRESAVLAHQPTDQLDNSIAQILSYLEKLNC